MCKLDKKKGKTHQSLHFLKWIRMKKNKQCFGGAFRNHVVFEAS